MAARRQGRVRGSARAWCGLLSAASVLAGGLVVAVAAPTAQAVQSPTSCSSTVALTNGDFEQPAIPDNANRFILDSQVPGWLTTASDHYIEVWSSSYQGVPAGSGRQYAELNANMASTLYQDLPTTPGQVLRWQLRHRGRSGVDVMAVVLGKPNGPLVSQGSISDGKTAWGTHSGLYVVPPGQTTTRFGFQAVSTAGGNNTIGNFLDDISFGTSACVITTETVTTPSGGSTARVGELLTYTVTARNGGGNPARLSVMSDQLPTGVTFVPGSIRAVTGSATATRTDAAGDDQGEYDPATRTVTVRVGSGSSASAGGSIPAGESRSFSYQVRVDPTRAETTVSDDATTDFTDDLTGTRSTSRSNLVSTSIDPAADLSATVTQDTADVVAGSAVQYTMVVTNDGPSSATGTRLTAAVPAGLTSVVAGTATGSCTVNGTDVVCDHGTLAAGATATVTITGSVPAGVPPGTQYTLSATASGSRFDHDPTDNSASVSDSVTASADLGVTLSSAPTTPIAGQDVTYTAVVTNQGPSTARGIVLSDPIVTGSTNPRASVPGGTCSVTGTGTVECALPDLAPGASSTVTITVQLSASGGGAVDNEVSVTSATPDPDPADNTASQNSTSTTVADLGVDLTITANTAYPGDTVGFTLTVHNAGPSTATNVSFNTVVPPGVTVVRPANPYCTTTACTLPAIPVGHTVTISGTAVVAATAEEGPGHARTTVISPSHDGNAANDSDSVSFTVLLSSDLASSQTTTNPDAAGSAVAGGRVRDVVTVTNDGPTRAEAVVLRQAVPAGEPVPTTTTGAGACAFTGTADSQGLATDAGSVVCTLDELADGGTWSVTFDTQLPASFASSSFARPVTVESSSPDPDPADNTSGGGGITVDRRSDVAVSQTALTPAVVQTDEVRFRVTVTNAGPSDARDVLVREQPEPGVLVSAGIPVVGTYSAGSGNWRIPVLPVGGTAVLDVVGTAQAGGSIVNVVSYLSAESTDPDPANDRASATVVATAAVRQLSVAVTSLVTPASAQNAVRAGDAIDSEYSVRNDGNVTMSSVRLVDVLVGDVPCPQTTLTAGATMTCAAPVAYVVTQADVDRRVPVVVEARLYGLAPDSVEPLAFGPSTVQIPVYIPPAPPAPPVVDPVQPDPVVPRPVVEDPGVVPSPTPPAGVPPGPATDDPPAGPTSPDGPAPEPERTPEFRTLEIPALGTPPATAAAPAAADPAPAGDAAPDDADTVAESPAPPLEATAQETGLIDWLRDGRILGLASWGVVVGVPLGLTPLVLLLVLLRRRRREDEEERAR